MSIADRPSAEIVEQLRLREVQLEITTQRAESAEHKLDAANQRIAGLKQTIQNLHQYMDRQNGDYLDLYAENKAAERKLANLRLLSRREVARKSYTVERAKEMWGHALRICGPGESLGILRDESLAQIEQPQGTPSDTELLQFLQDEHLVVGWDDPVFVVCKLPSWWSLQARRIGGDGSVSMRTAIKNAIQALGQNRAAAEHAGGK